MTEIGLRERKKAATRAALSRAAARLAVERGVDGVTIEEIAETAGVSARTFHNYFAGKEEAITAPLTDGVLAILDGLRARPSGEPVWDALHAVVAGLLAEAAAQPAEAVALLRVIKTDPSLVASRLCGLAEMQGRVAGLIAERTGTDAGRDVYPHLVAGAAGVAIRAAVDLWSDDPFGTDLGVLIDTAFAQLRAGLPPPVPDPV
ncbi:TetR family transcriptional regulator [Spirillospora albida]|uniref:acyl-CoA-like ligand-binding transcription factor n=1 Tax=Spirillospora albida TaxID=58123 RepID=UPI0004BF4263|nr:TetR family transcriptional regulator [Spirillospora albida]